MAAKKKRKKGKLKGAALAAWKRAHPALVRASKKRRKKGKRRAKKRTKAKRKTTKRKAAPKRRKTTKRKAAPKRRRTSKKRARKSSKKAQVITMASLGLKPKAKRAARVSKGKAGAWLDLPAAYRK